MTTDGTAAVAATGSGPQPEATRPARRGRAARVVGGLAVLTLAAGAVAAGAQLGAADEVPVGAVEVQAPPAPTTLGCVGTLQPPDERRRGDAAFDPSPVAPVTALDAVVPTGPGAGALTVLGGTGGEVERAGAGGASLRVEDVEAPLVVRAAPADEAPVVAAATTSLVTAGDLRGLSAASCVAPGVDDWLVGGATTVGSSAVLVLSNPGLTTAEVTAEVWGPNGPVESAAARHVVAPGATQTVDLGGAAAEQRALVVHVTTTGGQVVAHLQASVVEGFTPAGTDLVVPGAAPATRQVVPGVVVEESQVGAEVGPALRLLAPGDEATTARVTLLGADGPVEPAGVEEVELAAGTVVDVPLSGLAAGAWTVVVDASAPVVAAAVVTRTGTAGELDDRPRVERAWSAASAAARHGVVALPREAAARLVVGAVAEGDDATATGEGRARLRVLDEDGGVLSEHDVTVDAGTTGSWPVADLAEGAAGLELEVLPGARVDWAVELEVLQEDGALVSVLAPVPVVDGDGALRVREDGRATRG
ncbi:hypothetical protein GC089_06135 [Cellulomonas sp. JZ18]|uniref:DUF5719 family protein n=1 Tax=Cellulomonas sp. JZ18 TaxID=2654191 RepID=UPI0012D381FF|nr:DUF5719 family protein [Cellulomonas sp. JZ18]QGQ18899.1 hypothetical protein GC089_06135 [Cellulomonas sp. JZ18]